MKLFKNMFVITLLFITNSLEPKGLKTPNPSHQNAQKAPLPTKKPLQPPIIQRPSVQPSNKQEIRHVHKPHTYAQALDIIRTKMPSHKIIVNNTLTQEFIDFIKSLNLSTIETVALLEAGTHLHTLWTGDIKKDQQIITLLQQSITSMTQHKPITHHKPEEPYSIPLSHKASKDKQPKPAEQKKQLAEQPIKNNLSVQKYFATNNLIMLLDPEKAETMENNQRAIVQDALLGLYERAAPIIMTSNIWEIITNLRQTVGENNLQKLRNSNYNQTIPFAQQLITSYKLRENELLLIILSLITFDNKNFNCYFHTSENLILIIPKQYLQEGMSNPTHLNDDQVKACGFNSTVIIPVDDLNPNNLLKQLKLQQAIPKQKNAFISNLTSLFIPQKKYGELISPTQDTPWAIFLAGHGGAFYQSIGTIREQLAINKQNLSFFKNALARNKNDHKAAENIGISETNIKKYEKIVHNKSNWPNSQLLVGTANIAGIHKDDFATLMEFFDQNLNVGFLHYTSCFAGGYNQTFVNETLSDLDVNFITSTQGVDERQTTGISLDLMFSSQAPHISLSKKPFTEFFKLLRLFLTDQQKFVKMKEYKKEKEPVAKILRAIVSDVDETNQPFVRFPGAGVFGALSLGKTTKNLTNVMVKAHEIENKSINFNDTAINAVIINPSRINVPVNFGKNVHCALISPTPEIITPAHEAIHIFKEINFENDLQSLVFNFVALNARVHMQTFVIKKLTGFLYQQSGLPNKPGPTNIIHNFIIQIRSIPGHIMRAHVVIVFELNGTMYQSSVEINNFEDPTLENYIKSIHFTPTTDINSVTTTFLTPKEITKLKKPINLESIAYFIDSKIDQEEQPSLFEQPDEDTKALHDFLKRKKLT